MSCRVEHDPNIVLWLVIGETWLRVLAGERHAFLEVLDGDVEMDHHLLLAGRGRPDRCDVVRRRTGTTVRLPPSGDRSITHPSSGCSPGLAGSLTTTIQPSSRS